MHYLKKEIFICISCFCVVLILCNSAKAFNFKKSITNLSNKVTESVNEITESTSSPSSPDTQQSSKETNKVSISEQQVKQKKEPKKKTESASQSPKKNRQSSTKTNKSSSSKQQAKQKPISPNNSKPCIDDDFTSKMARKWDDGHLHHIKCEEARGWIECGVKSPSKADRYKKAGIPLSDFKIWLTLVDRKKILSVKNRFSLEEAQKWKSNSVPLIYKSYSSPSEAYAWQRKNFSPQNAGYWIKSGITSASKAENYVKSGYEAEKFYQWVKLGYSKDDIEKYYNAYDVHEVSSWENVGIPLTKLNNWKQAGFTPQTAEPWIKLGFACNEAKIFVDKSIPIDEVKAWYAIQVQYPSLIDWKQAGFTPQTAEPWAKSGITYNDAKIFVDKGITTNEAKEWYAIQVQYSNLLDWKQAGFTPQTAEPWAKSGITYNEAKIFVDEGITLEEVSKWSEIGVNQKDIVECYNYFSLDELKAWLAISNSVEDAKSFKKAGFSPSEAQKWLKHGFSPEVALSYKTQNKSLEEVIKLEQERIAKEQERIAKEKERIAKEHAEYIKTCQSEDFIKDNYRSNVELFGGLRLGMSPDEALNLVGKEYEMTKNYDPSPDQLFRNFPSLVDSISPTYSSVYGGNTELYLNFLNDKLLLITLRVRSGGDVQIIDVYHDAIKRLEDKYGKPEQKNDESSIFHKENISLFCTVENYRIYSVRYYYDDIEYLNKKCREKFLEKEKKSNKIIKF